VAVEADRRAVCQYVSLFFSLPTLNRRERPSTEETEADGIEKQKLVDTLSVSIEGILPSSQQTQQQQQQQQYNNRYFCETNWTMQQPRLPHDVHQGRRGLD